MSFFDGWNPILRALIVGPLAYASMVILLRVSGKRTLSKMNAFDFVITVALGSVMASVTLSKDVPVAEGVAAFAVLLGMQYLITWLSVRVPAVRQMIKSEPALLVHQGAFMDQAMKRERVTESEVEDAHAWVNALRRQYDRDHPPEVKVTSEALLTEIRDLLKARPV